MVTFRLLILLVAAVAAAGGLTACAQRTSGIAVTGGGGRPSVRPPAPPSVTLADPTSGTRGSATQSRETTPRATTRATSREEPSRPTTTRPETTRPTTAGPATTRPETSDPSTPATTTGTGPLAAIAPCDLLSPAESDRLRLGDRTARTVGVVRVCRFRYQGETLSKSYTVEIELFDGYGVKDIVGAEQPRPVTIGDHTGVSWLTQVGGCALTLGIDESSRVDLTAVGGDVDFGCELTRRLAGAVEPRLP